MHGCGTLASPSGFDLGNRKKMSATFNGKQHLLPSHPKHDMAGKGESKLMKEEVEEHWAKQTLGPQRLYGTMKNTRFGGLEREDGKPDRWTKGEFWNTDSNIRIWGEHEVKRNAAEQNHDTHRHDMITRMMIVPQPGVGIQHERQCVSGVMSPDCCFLEAWGFDLGQRDRQGMPIKTKWKFANSNEQFRGKRAYQRDIPRMLDNFRTMRKSRSSPGSTFPVGPVTTLRPEDVGGEAGDIQEAHAGADKHIQPEHSGRPYGSRSCRGWDSYDHCTKREGAKMSVHVHQQSLRSHPEGHPIKDHMELNPAAIYTKRFISGGEENLRKNPLRSTKVPFNHGRTFPLK
jgi:hypothetical protein